MINITTALIITVAILSLFLVYIKVTKKIENEENYAPYRRWGYIYPSSYPYYYGSYGWYSRRGLLPWWNSTRNTTNMSYDIRGDVPVTRHYTGPWLNSTIRYW